MALTDVKVRNAKPRSTASKLFDGDGLFLLVSPTGRKGWRFKYRFGGKEKLISFGAFPEVSLGDARDKRTAARRQVAAGIDPSSARRAQKAAQAQENNSFEVVAREWHTKFSATWAASHAVTILSRLQRDVFPFIGAKPIAEIHAPYFLLRF